MKTKSLLLVKKDVSLCTNQQFNIMKTARKNLIRLRESLKTDKQFDMPGSRAEDRINKIVALLNDELTDWYLIDA